MKTRITALLLALVMAVCCLTGCTSTRVRSYSEESSDASTDKYAAALDAYKSNKKVMTINGSPVYWNEYAYFLCAIMANMERYGMQITDWSDVYDESTGETYSDIMTKSVVNNVGTTSSRSRQRKTTWRLTRRASSTCRTRSTRPFKTSWATTAPRPS